MVDNELLYEKEITIYSDKSDFVFSKSFNGKIKYVSINKETNSVQILPQYNPKIGTGSPVYAIVGMIHGKINNYILAVNRASFLGLYLNSKVFKIEEFSYISSVSNDQVNYIHEEDRPYIQMIDCFLARNSLYYSDSIDLTATVNTILNTNTKISSLIFPKTIPHFCWNYNITRNLDSSDLFGFIHPIINGFVGIRSVCDYPQEFTYIVISRKDSRRSGMRLLVRGNDKNGNSANFVETEHIVIQRIGSHRNKFNVFSYLQIRGSMPFLWTQLPNLLFNPKIVPRTEYNENYATFRKHMNELVPTYGRVVLVNLIDRKGDQNRMGEYFTNLSKDLKETKGK